MLEIRSVSKSFSGVRVLSDVSFTVARGEVHALMGENGAGKSTLMNILSGAYADYNGALLLDGKPLAMRNPRDAQKLGIAIVHQELNLVPELTVAENIFLGREPRTALGLLDCRKLREDTIALLRTLQATLPMDRPVRELRIGEQQLVEIAKALTPDLRLLILDEPTSALSDTEIAHLFTVIATLKKRGVTMIYISHKLDEIFAIADRVTVLRDGRYIATQAASETNADALIRMMVGRTLEDLAHKEVTMLADDALRVEGLSLRTVSGHGRALQDISFRLRRGEIVGVAGLMGAGRTEMLEALFGACEPSRVSGRITVGGLDGRFSSPAQAISAGMAFVTEDRKNQSLVMSLSVRSNITLASLRQFSKGGLIDRASEADAARQSIATLRIKTPREDALVGTLSGGNQQKVVLAKCLLTQPRVLLLDEPTRGIDVGAKAEIYALISRLAAQGTAILMASSEMPELLALCDRIMVLREGRLTADLPRAKATQERIMEAATEHAT